MFYTLVLLLAAVVYNFCASPGPDLIGGILPIAVPWFGALGAVTISLEGVFLLNNRWDTSYNYWHIGRPLFGAVLGIVAFFLFVVIVSASGSPPKFLDFPSPKPPLTAAQGTTTATGTTATGTTATGTTATGTTPTGTVPPSPKDFIIFYVVAFLVGYREETFRDLIKRATDLILKPGTPNPTAPEVAFQIAGKPVTQVDLTAAATTKTLQVQNPGNATLTAPNIALTLPAGTPAGVISLNNNLLNGHTDLAPGQTLTVDVVFAPPAPAAPPAPRTFAATLVLTATNLSAPKYIQVSATG